MTEADVARESSAGEDAERLKERAKISLSGYGLMARAVWVIGGIIVSGILLAAMSVTIVLLLHGYML